MLLDVFVSQTPVYYFHTIYPALLYIFFEVFHILRWADGAKAFHSALDFGKTYRSSAILFLFLLILIMCPAVHGMAYAIGRAREWLVDLRNTVSRQRCSRVLVTPKKEIPSFGDFMVIKYRLNSPGKSAEETNIKNDKGRSKHYKPSEIT